MSYKSVSLCKIGAAAGYFFGKRKDRSDAFSECKTLYVGRRKILLIWLTWWKPSVGRFSTLPTYRGQVRNENNQKKYNHYITSEQICNIFTLFYLKRGDKLVNKHKSRIEEVCWGTKVEVASKVRDRYQKTFNWGNIYKYAEDDGITKWDYSLMVYSWLLLKSSVNLGTQGRPHFL